MGDSSQHSFIGVGETDLLLAALVDFHESLDQGGVLLSVGVVMVTQFGCRLSALLNFGLAPDNFTFGLRLAEPDLTLFVREDPAGRHADSETLVKPALLTASPRLHRHWTRPARLALVAFVLPILDGPSEERLAGVAADAPVV